MTNHSGWPKVMVEPSATRASQGGLLWLAAPMIGSTAAAQAAARFSGAGSRAGADSEPSRSSSRAAITLPAMATAREITIGASQGLLDFSSRTLTKSSAVRSSSSAVSLAPATDW